MVEAVSPVVVEVASVEDAAAEVTELPAVDVASELLELPAGATTFTVRVVAEVRPATLCILVVLFAALPNGQLSVRSLGTAAQVTTAVIALGALAVGIQSIEAQREIARKRAAMDFFAKTEMDG